MSMQTTVSRARAARFEAAPYLLPALCAVAMLLCNPAEARKVITVFNATQLYSAVNTPGNAGALVLLAPGNYPLDPTQPVNGGRLELQHDMALQGMSADPTATVIDAHAL